MLEIFATHITQPVRPNGRPEYHMNKLGSYSLTHRSQVLHQAITAFRNTRDWAREQRNELIRSANQRYLQTRTPISGSGLPRTNRGSNAQRVVGEDDDNMSDDDDEEGYWNVECRENELSGSEDGEDEESESENSKSECCAHERNEDENSAAVDPEKDYQTERDQRSATVDEQKHHQLDEDNDNVGPISYTVTNKRYRERKKSAKESPFRSDSTDELAKEMNRLTPTKLPPSKRSKGSR